jgi:endonuclease/exonuclease/phosphatase family metal-dependent hydrolase
MKKQMKRYLILLLSILLLASSFTACSPTDPGESLQEKTVVFDRPLTIIYAQSEGEIAKEAALLLRESLQDALGYKPTVVTDRAFQGDVTADCVLILGNVDAAIPTPDVELKGEAQLTLTENGAYLCAKSDKALYLAAQKIAELWPTAEYGYRDDTLVLTNTMCKTFSEQKLGSDALISVMSQNIRCANDGDGNDIADRKIRFKKLMAEYQPDLLGTQETTAEWNRIFEEYFGEEYGMVGCSREGENATDGEWNTILYKKSRFDLVEGGTFWLSATPYKVSEVYGSLCKRICTWALLLDKLTGEKVFFANTHLDHGNDNVREKQAKYLVDQLASYMSEYPTFLTGDFNTSNKNAPYKTITDKMSDAHKAAIVDESTVKGTYHNYGAQTPAEIDFCFYNDRSVALSYRILSDSYSGYVSDHYGLITHFAVK